MSSSPGGARIVERPAEIRYPGHEPTAAVARLRLRNPAQRSAAAVKAWGLCWLAAIGAVFIPVLHFILVPALLIGGPVLAFAQLGEKVTLLRAAGPCPACGRPVEHTVRQRAVETVRLRCDACGRAIELVLGPAGVAAEEA